ncbi:hypothetical protein PENTCL1PPCAC_14588, partial [Pristionchus entomophagus]
SLIPIINPRGSDVTEKSKKLFVPQSQETENVTNNLNPIGVLMVSGIRFSRYKIAFQKRKAFALPSVAQCSALLNETALLESLRAEKFDVFIAENFEMCGVAYSHLLNAKSLITVAAAYPFSYMFEEFGIPLALSNNPSAFISHLDVHSMWSRLKNIYANWLMHALMYPRRSLVSFSFSQERGSESRLVQQISSHSAYTLVNAEPLIDFATPTLNRVVSVGGIGAKIPKALDEKWNNILSIRPKNILISFGSNVKAANLPENIKNSIATVIGRFPDITFIWKYEELNDLFANETTSAHPNLVLTAWMPQNDLLNDDRVSVFVTHGGMGSTLEMALRGKPGVFVPLFGDQPRNAGMMEFNGLGKVLDKFDLHDSDKVEVVIREVLTNENYAENARKVSAKLSKKPFGARALLIKTVEFAAEFGPSKALRPQSYDMNTIEYHNIDIALLAIFVLFSLVFAVKRLAMWILSKYGV